MKQIIRAALVCILCFFTSEKAYAQSALSVDDERKAKLEEFAIDEVPNLPAISSFSENVFSASLEQQTEEDLKRIAKEANHVANLISIITEEYDSYRRENYKYDFVLEKLKEPRDAYIERSNYYIGLRNQAYFNLGLKAKKNGQSMAAYMYFRDAFRLSSFDCLPKTKPQDCMRWKAEQEMQGLLGLNEIKAYVSWK